MSRLALIIITAYIAWCGVLFVAQELLIFPHWLAGKGDAKVARRHGIKQFWITADDGSQVEGWFAIGAGRSTDDPGPAVIFAHGNGELIDGALDMVELYKPWGVSVLLPEYRGYGRSGGKPSQKATNRDMEAFHAWLARRPEVDPTRIVYHGRSLGGGIIADLAAARPPAALILQSTFTSLESMSWRYGVPPFVCRHPFRTDRVLEAYMGPVLIFHGTRDRVVPVAHGRRLHKLAPNAVYVEVDAGHNDLPPDFDSYRRTIRAFLLTNGLIPGPDLPE